MSAKAQSPEKGPVLSLEDCLKYADETRDLVNKKDAINEIPRILRQHFEFDSVCLIADENTFAAAGKKVKDALDGAGITISGVHIFPAEPRLHAEYEHIRFMKTWIPSLPGYSRCVPIAVGGGTINDLVKRAAWEIKLPYLCVPTAASVDGYTAYGASLLMDGFKQTVPCTAPRVLVAETEVISKAPPYLSSSGFGDLASKIIAGTDWLIAAKAGDLGAPGCHAMNPIAWQMIQNNLIDILNRSIGAARGDGDAVNTLFQSLAITGFSMQYMKNSRPVSGAEHLWSHVWEMEDLSVGGVPVTHGHKVTIGTLAATAFTEIFFADPSGPPAPASGYKRQSKDERKEEVSRVFKNSRGRDMVVNEAMEKMLDEKSADKINQAFRDTWKEIRDQVLEKLLPYAELKELLARAQCPLRGETIGLARNEVIATTLRAQMIRNKYCILDLAWDMGNMETVLKKMEDSEIYLR